MNNTTACGDARKAEGDRLQDKLRPANPKSKIQNPKSEGLLTECDVLTIQDLMELHGAEDALLRILLACMFAELNRGSLCLKIPSTTYSSVLEDVLVSASPCPPPPGCASSPGSSSPREGVGGRGGANAHASAIQDKLSGEDWRDLIGEPGGFTPMILVPAVGGDALYLYFQRYYEYERRVREQLMARIEAPCATDTLSQRESLSVLVAGEARMSPRQTSDADTSVAQTRAGEAVREVLASRPANVKWELSAGQRAALALAIRQRFLIISGGPGTGKTANVVSILRCLARLGASPRRMLLAAPTGRAAYRLTDAIRSSLGAIQDTAESDKALLGLEASTIHRLLRYRPSRHDFVHHAGNPLQADVIVIDEVSMVDAGLMASLLEAVPPEARLILLGDKDQLPSVEAGAILADLIPAIAAPSYSQDAAQWVRTVAGVQWPPAAGQGEPLDHVVVLTENHRAGETNIADTVRCLTGSPDQKAIEARLFAEVVEPLPAGDREDDAKALSCVWGTNAALPKGYHFIELTSEWAGKGRWSKLLQSWAWHHYLSASGDRVIEPSSEVTEKGLRHLARSPDRPITRSFKELLLQAAAQADFLGPGGISPELARDILCCVRSAQILTLLRNGRFGCTGVNAILMEYLGPKLDSHATYGCFSGLPILITRNNYDMNLFNGDAGVILRDREGHYRALFERRQLSAGFECFALDQLPPWEPAFAITVHKSQGSEYADVLLVVPPVTHGQAAHATAGDDADETPAQRLLTAEILYTGLTRASRLVLLCGTKEAIMQAAMRRVERVSGLAHNK